MGRKIFRSGNSTVVSIPPEVLELLDLEPGDDVNVIADPERHRIVVTPIETAGSEKGLEVRERLGELIERYAPALERLAEMEQHEQEAAEQRIGADALDKARALRRSFAARYGALTIDLVDAVRREREAETGLGLELPGENEGYEPGR